MPMDMIAFAALSRHILPGERLLWCGRPDPAAYASSRGGGFAGVGAALIVVGLVAEYWGLEAAFGAAVSVDPLLVAVTGLPFLAVGIGLALEPWRAYRRARHTVYGLTSERAIELQLKPDRQLRTIPRKAIRAILRRNGLRDTVDITFCPRASDRVRLGASLVDGFHGIRDAETVERLAMIDRRTRARV